MDAPAATPASESELAALRLAFRRVFRGLSRLRGRDTHLAAGELSHAQLELLGELFERGELPAGELALAAGLAPGTVTQLLDHLVAAGHVERVRSDSDRRVVLVRLSAHGRERIEAKRVAWSERWQDALGDLDAEELRGATRVLERLAAMVEQTPALSPDEGARIRSQAAGT